MKLNIKEKLTRRGPRMYQRYYFNQPEIIESIVASYDAGLKIDDSICDVVFATSDNGQPFLADLVTYYPLTLKKYKVITDEVCEMMRVKFYQTISLMKQYRKTAPGAKSIRGAMVDAARARNSDFGITGEDVLLPLTCPFLGIELEYGNTVATNHSPSLDRIDSTKGYTSDNIQVISFLANRMKNNANPDQLKKIRKKCSENLRGISLIGSL
jgi:hypothetical protein